MEHRPIDDLEWQAAPDDNFTGNVWFGAKAPPEDPDKDLNVLGVQFSPGARTDWHWHPGGQVIYVVSGSGTVVNRDGSRVEISPGDTVVTPPNEIHWHGAAPDAPMMHLSITVDGATVWTGEKVSDEDYR